MKRIVLREFDLLSENLSNQNAVFSYRLKNLCVKAEEVALLPIEVVIEGEPQKLEQCTVIGKKDDYSFMIFPKYDEDLIPIVKGIAETHPEFKIEGKQMPIESTDGEGNDQTIEVKYLLVTMPVVNDDRYDVLKDGVDAIYQDCKLQMERANSVSKAKFKEISASETKENLDALDRELDRLNGQWNTQRDKLYNEKLQEIEEAHNHWLAGKNESDQQHRESEKARGEKAAHSMRINSEDDE